MIICPECGRPANDHAAGCPNAAMPEPVGICDICHEPIYRWEDRYYDVCGYELVCDGCLIDATYTHLIRGE